jgi:tetratricopeptide (TPR) repeat protein
MLRFSEPLHQAVRPMLRLASPIALCLALACFGCVPATNPKAQGDAAIERGMKLYEEGSFAEAARELESAVALPHSSDQSDLLTTIGNTYNELREYEKALEFHERALAENPNNHRAHVNRGVVYRLQGEFDKAEESYKAALQIQPDYPELHASLGSLALHRGEFEAAIPHLERAIELQDNLPVGHANLAMGYASVGRFEEADKELKKAIIQGYKNGSVIRERIDDLKEVSDAK